MNFWRTSPGPCIVCGAAHSGCKPDGDGRIIIEQRPASARARARARITDTARATRGPFTTGTTPTDGDATDSHAQDFAARNPQGSRDETRPGTAGASPNRPATTTNTKATTT